MKVVFRHPLGVATLAGIAGPGLAAMWVVARAAGYYSTTDGVAHALVLAIGLGLLGGLLELTLRTLRSMQLYDEAKALPAKADAGTLAATSPALREWLQARLDRAPVPNSGPVFTPYLVGLLVMLGLLGTFLGLFDTLRGARDALTAGGDIEALRAGLAKPMEGLTRSFGSSAAGVSASALLGLAAVFVRRAEAKTAAVVRGYAANALQALSPYQQQHEALIALAEQGRALPAAADALTSLGGTLGALATRWEEAHAEAAQSTQQSIEAAVSGVRADLRAATEGSAERVHAVVTPLLEGAVERVGNVARTELSGMQRSLEGDRVARQKADTELRTSVRTEVEKLIRQGQQTLESVRERNENELQTLREATVSQIQALGTAIEENAEQSRLATQAELSALTDEIRLGADREREAGDEHLATLRRAAAEFSEQLKAQATGHMDAWTEANEAGRARSTAEAEAHVKLLRDSAADFSSVLGSQAAEFRQTASEFAAGMAEQATTHAEAWTTASEAGRQRASQEAETQAAALQQTADAFADTLGAHAAQFTEQLGEQAEGPANSLAASAERMGELAERFGAAVEQVRERDAAQVERAEQAVLGLEQATSAMTASLGSQQEQVSRLMDTTGGQITEFATAAATGAAATLEAIRESADQQAERLTTFTATLSRDHDQAAQSLTAVMQQHAEKMGSDLGQAGSTVKDAAEVLQASGAELSLVAEMFAASVEGQREAANAWMENLGELENAIEQAGREAAADALGDQLASTQEVFARQLQFQRELFEQLQNLRPDGTGHHASA